MGTLMNIAVAVELWRVSPRALTYARGWLFLSFAVLCLILAFSFANPEMPITVGNSFNSIARLTTLQALGLAAPFGVLMLWQFRVLLRADVAALFVRRALAG
jgi:hypothetical protein